MYLKTPKRYTAKGKRRYLFNLRFLWLYILVPVLIIPLVLLWNERGPISQRIAEWTGQNIRINLNPPTITPTVPAADLRTRYTSFVQAGSFDNAISTLYSLLDTSPNDVELHVRLTETILFRGDPDDPARRDAALGVAQRAVNANPEAADGWIVMGMAYNSSGQPRQALSYLLRARDLSPENPLLLAVLADTYNGLDQVEQASDLASRAIERAKAAQPVDIVALTYAHIVQGTIAARESGERAIRSYEEAWRVAQNEPMIPLGFVAQWVAGYYLTTDEADKVIPVLTDASNRDKDDPINPYLLGRVYLNRGDLERARTFLERCREIAPDQVKCLRWLATVLYRTNNYQRAAELAQRAIDLGTTDPGAYVVAGAAYADLNRCSEAIPILRRAAELDRGGPLASQIDTLLRQCGAASAPPPPPPTATGTP